MKPITTFGVGCFHFDVESEPPYRFSSPRYAKTIRKLLGDLDTVSDFSVSSLNRPAFHEISFSLRLPQRVQEDIVKTMYGSDYRWTGLGTEHFMVRTRYFVHGPATVVECLDLDENGHSSPSTAIVIVREYLRHKLGELSTDVRLECTGPSPFHTDFFVFETEEDRPYIEHKERRGYDTAHVYIPTYISEDHVAWLLRRVGHHLSFYYDLMRTRARYLTQWGSINEALSRLNESRSRSWFDRIGVSRRKSKGIEAVVHDILMFRATMLSNRQRAVSTKNKMQAENENMEFFDRKVDEALEKTFRDYPTSELLELAKFHEARHSKWRDRVYLLLAAVVGGTIGAMLSLWSQAQ